MENHSDKYRVFTRAALNFEQFAIARKVPRAKGLSFSDARQMCDEGNATLTSAQKRRGMKYEFERM